MTVNDTSATGQAAGDTDPAADQPGEDAPPRLRLRDISKHFGAVQAVRHADLTVRAGRVHALVGENGAGKSTMIKIVAGAEAADTGTIEFDGTEVRIASTTDALALGIATVYQEPQLFAELTVSENIFVGRELRRGARVDWAAQNARVVQLLELLGLPARYATVTVGSLSIAEQQQVSIAKALAGDATVLILDEPSAILTDAEIDVLFAVVRRLTAAGVAVIYISHRLDELFRIADEVTVMRDGRTIGTYPIEQLTVRQIAELMVGGILSDTRPHRAVSPGPPVLQLNELSRVNRFHNVNVTVRRGEIVALYGLVGSGVSEIAACVYGIDRATGGELQLHGRPIAPRSPREAQRLGIALLPANRKSEGMFSFQSIAFNISAGHLRLLSRLGVVVDRNRERRVARDLIRRLSVKTPHERQPISAMSGGNSQKVVLARQLVRRPDVLILAEPTQGVDVGAKEEIHRIITDLADDGTAVLVVTSDLPEALRIADRIQVVRGGTTTVEFGPDASQVDVLAAAAGSEPAAAGSKPANGGDAPMSSTALSTPGVPEPGPPAGEPRAVPPRPRGRILPPPVSGQELVLVGVIAVLWFGLALATPAFMTAGSMQPLLVSTAPIALVCVGMTIVIITGGIDVSVGAGIMVCSVLTAKSLVEHGLGLPAAIGLSVLAGGLLGCVNGLLIAYGRIHAIIITFGTANLFLFVGLQIFGSQTVNGIPATLAVFGRGPQGRTLGVPHAFLLTVIITALAWWYLRHTAGGRHLFAIGGDPHAARLAGVRVQRRVLLAYVITGLLVGLASCFVIAQGTSTLDQSVGSGKELAVIAAVVIGGTSIMGGRGSVLGTLLGALLVQSVTSGVTQLGWSSQLSDLFVGVFIIIAVGADLLRARARRTS